MSAPEIERWSWGRDLLLTAVLSGLAAYADWFAPGVFFGHSLVLGNVFYLIGVRLVGPYAALAVLAAITATLVVKWQQPFSALLIALEGLAVAGAWRRRINPLLADLAYWIVLGTPLSWFLYRHVVVIPDPSFTQALLLQPANGLVAVWLSYLVRAVHCHGALMARSRGKRAAKYSSRESSQRLKSWMISIDMDSFCF